MHWKTMGDYSFDPKYWPAVPAMVANLSSIGMRVMVSVWPFQATGSATIEQVTSNYWALTSRGTSSPVAWNDNNCRGHCVVYDPSQQPAREYIWSKIKQGYYDMGIKIFW